MKPLFRTKWRLVLVIIAAVIIVFLLQITSLLSPVEKGVTFVFRPVQQVFWHAGDQLKSISGYFQKNSDLRKENESLRQQLTALATENVSLQKKIGEIGDIAKQYEFVTQKKLHGVTGQIIGRSSDEFTHVVIFNKGSSDAIKAGYPVISNDGVFIGKVLSTTGEISKIQLLTDNHSQVNAVVQNQANSPGIVNGQFGITLLMDFIPQNQTIAPGQLVLTSGLEENIPSNLLLGSVTQVTKKEGELFQTATVDPAITYQSLNIITVILPNNG
jgi:rod shape-determining protein MreC